MTTHPITSHDWRPGAWLFAVYASSWVTIDMCTYVNIESMRRHMLLMAPAYAGVVAGPASLTAWCLLSRAPAWLRWPVLLFGGALMTIIKVAVLGWDSAATFPLKAAVIGAAIVILQFAVTGAAIAIASRFRTEEPPESRHPAERLQFGVKDLLFWMLLAAMLTAVVTTASPWLFPAKEWRLSDADWRTIAARVAEVTAGAALAAPCVWVALTGDLRGCSCLLLCVGVPAMLMAAAFSYVFHMEAVVLYVSLLPLRIMDIHLLPPGNGQRP